MSSANGCSSTIEALYKGVSKIYRTGQLERELQMAQLSVTMCSYIAILWVSLVSFAAITLCVASQWIIPTASVCFVIDSVRELLDAPSYAFNILARYIKFWHLSHFYSAVIDIFNACRGCNSATIFKAEPLQYNTTQNRSHIQSTALQTYQGLQWTIVQRPRL
jgi:hypothetical protein